MLPWRGNASMAKSPGYPEGTEFTNRKELADAGVHRPLQGGISGGKDGADSIVVSGGYPDDEDFGNEIIYTGQGGRDPATGKQVRDQELVLGNMASSVAGWTTVLSVLFVGHTKAVNTHPSVATAMTDSSG